APTPWPVSRRARTRFASGTRSSPSGARRSRCTTVRSSRSTCASHPRADPSASEVPLLQAPAPRGVDEAGRAAGDRAPVQLGAVAVAAARRRADRLEAERVPVGDPVRVVRRAEIALVAAVLEGHALLARGRRADVRVGVVLGADVRTAPEGAAAEEPALL